MATVAVYLQKAGDAHRAGQRIDEALQKAPKDIDVLYRAAVIRALQGRSDEAITLIRQAVNGGISRARVGEEDDFGQLKTRADFQTLVNPAKP